MRLPIDTSRLQFLVVAGAEVIRVSVPGDPKVAQGDMVRPDGLVAQPWEMGDRSGVSFRCAAINAAGGRSTASQKAAA